MVGYIGVLVSIVLGALGQARSHTRDAVRKSDLRTLQIAYEMYLNDGLGTGTTVLETEYACDAASDRLITQLLDNGYLSRRINDPIAVVTACGTSIGSGEVADYMFTNYGNGSYCICANLENDPAATCTAGGWCGVTGMDYEVCI